MLQTHLTTKEIKKIVYFLKDSLPKSPTAITSLYVLPLPLERELANSKFPNFILQKISDNMGHYLGFIKSIKVNYVQQVGFNQWYSVDGHTFSDVGVSNKAGMYSVKGLDHSEIFIFKKNRYNNKNLLAILAHEYAHHYLFLKNVKKENTQDDEIMTDIAAVFLGFGKLIFEGYKAVTWSSDSGFFEEKINYTLNFGYITRSTIRRAIKVSAKARSWTTEETLTIFTNTIDRLLISVPMMIEDYMKDDDPSVICPFCRKKIKKNSKKCPHCEGVLIECIK